MADVGLGLAPVERRQSFVSLANTFIGPTMLLPLLGGTLVDWTSPPVLFGPPGPNVLWKPQSPKGSSSMIVGSSGVGPIVPGTRYVDWELDDRRKREIPGWLTRR